MAIDTVHTRPKRSARDRPHVVEVSDMPAERVVEFAADAEVHLERRGGRTYLVTPN